MPPRTVKIRHDENTRLKIQAAQIINRLQNHFEGTVDLSPTQIKTAEILLRKSLPDLSSVTIGGDADNPLFKPGMTEKELDELITRLSRKNDISGADAGTGEG